MAHTVSPPAYQRRRTSDGCCGPGSHGCGDGGDECRRRRLPTKAAPKHAAPLLAVPLITRYIETASRFHLGEGGARRDGAGRLPGHERDMMNEESHSPGTGECRAGWRAQRMSAPLRSIAGALGAFRQERPLERPPGSSWCRRVAGGALAAFSVPLEGWQSAGSAFFVKRRGAWNPSRRRHTAAAMIGSSAGERQSVTQRRSSWGMIPFSPAWSPDRARLAFVSAWHGRTALYVRDADGSGRLPLTDDDELVDGPAWSPDGRLIAFTAYRNGDGDVYVIHADGTGRLRLTDTPGFDIHPAWSPDGVRIAFTSGRNTQCGDLSDELGRYASDTHRDTRRLFGSGMVERRDSCVRAVEPVISPPPSMSAAVMERVGVRSLMGPDSSVGRSGRRTAPPSSSSSDRDGDARPYVVDPR